MWDMGYGLWDMRYGLWDMRSRTCGMRYKLWNTAVTNKNLITHISSLALRYKLKIFS